MVLRSFVKINLLFHIIDPLKGNLPLWAGLKFENIYLIDNSVSKQPWSVLPLFVEVKSYQGVYS